MLVIVGVLIGTFYAVFITNWAAFEDRIARTHMWHQANEIMETVTDDGRFAHVINVVNNPDGSESAIFLDALNQPIVTYTIGLNGEFQMVRNGLAMKVLSDQLDPIQSDFALQGESLRFQLVMQEELFNRNIGFQTSTEVFPRN